MTNTVGTIVYGSLRAISRCFLYAHISVITSTGWLRKPVLNSGISVTDLPVMWIDPCEYGYAVYAAMEKYCPSTGGPFLARLAAIVHISINGRVSL